MRNSAILVAAAAALIGISAVASPADAQGPRKGRNFSHGQRHPGGGARGPVQGGPRNFAGGGGHRGGHGPGGGPRGRGPGHHGGGWHGRGPGGGGWHGRGHGNGAGIALGAAALGLVAGALLAAPPPPAADECMQQVWVRGAWRWRNVCD